MRKTYKCSNIKFCMEDENQRRTWEYLQGITRKDGSYGKILSDAFVEVLDRGIQETDKAEGDSVILKEQTVDAIEEVLDRALEQKFHEMLQELKVVFEDQISRNCRGYASDSCSSADNHTHKTDADGMGQTQEAELSEDMMAFAFTMGE
ncbi:MAG: hypothetical protein K1W36_19960 [Lachnospiraceae bacterium]